MGIFDSDSESDDTGWGAALGDLIGGGSDDGESARGGTGWDAIGGLVDRLSGGDAKGDMFNRVVEQVGAYVPHEMRDAAEALLRGESGGASSWVGPIVDAVSHAGSEAVGGPAHALAPDVAPGTAHLPVAADDDNASFGGQGPAPVHDAAPAAYESGPSDDDIPDDPTFDDAIASAPEPLADPPDVAPQPMDDFHQTIHDADQMQDDFDDMFEGIQ